MFEKQWRIYEPFWNSCTKHVLFISRKKSLCFFLTKLLMKLLKFHHTKMRFTTNTGKIRRVEDTEGGTGSSKTVPTTKMAVEPTKHGTLTNQTLEEQRAWDWTN